MSHEPNGCDMTNDGESLHKKRSFQDFCVFFFQDVSSVVPQEKESEDQQKVQLFEDLSSHNPCENYNECPKNGAGLKRK